MPKVRKNKIHLLTHTFTAGVCSICFKEVSEKFTIYRLSERFQVYNISQDGKKKTVHQLLVHLCW